jgi:tetratricopeptide (TPR) repeat protein
MRRFLVVVGVLCSLGCLGAKPVMNETKDRTSPDYLQSLVTKPLAEWQGGSVDQAKRDFETLLTERKNKYGSNALVVADTLSAFGVTLYTAAIQGDPVIHREDGLPYLRRAIQAYRAHFGQDTPEVALAYCDFANAERGALGNKAIDEEYASMSECLRIRQATLGPHNAETAMSMAYVAGLQGLPARTMGDDDKIDAAAAMYEQAIADYKQSKYQVRREISDLIYDIAVMYLWNHRIDKAMAYFDKAATDESGEPSFVRDNYACRFYNLLAKEGYADKAAEIARRFPCDTPAT